MSQTRRSFFGAVTASLLAPRLIPPDPASISFHARNFRAGKLSNEIIIRGGCRSGRSTKLFRVITAMKENQ